MSNDCIDAKAVDSLASIQGAMKQDPLFYLLVPGNDKEVDGPYDLVQMAGLLRQKIITTETLTRMDGEQAWKPFGDRPQFIVAKEIPADAVSTRVIELRDAAKDSNSPIPLPSAAFLVKVGALALLLVVAGAASFLLAWADPTLGLCLEVAGGGAALLGVALIYVTLADEDAMTVFWVFIFPLYDLYYFLVNFEKYLPYFYLAYLGTVISLAAAAGMAAGSPGHG